MASPGNRERIALLLPDLRPGGAERVIVNLANAFAARGYRVDVVLMAKEGAFLADLDPAVEAIGLGAARVRGVLKPLVRYLKERRPEAMLACVWPLTALAVWANRLAGGKTRVVVAEHTTWSTSPILRSPLQRIAFRLTMRLAFPRAAAAVTVSHGAAEDLSRITGLRRDLLTTVYNPIVGARRGPVGPPERLPERWWHGGHKRILAVGTLKEIKDYPTLLRAFARLRTETDARLLILGEGDCRAELEALAAQLGIAQDLELFGFVADPAPYFRRADLHVLSSRGEGLPTVIVEALEAGVPVVSTDCPSGPREILEDGLHGRLVPVGDASALAHAMREALSEEPRREALLRRAQEFGVDRISDRYLELLLGSRGGDVH